MANSQPIEFTGNPDIDGVLWGWEWTGGGLTYSFPTSSAEYTNNGYDSVSGFAPLTAGQQTAAIRILANYDNVSGLSFTQAAAGTIAHIRMARVTAYDDGDNGNRTVGTGYAHDPDPNVYPAYSFGDAFFNINNYSTNPTPGTYSYTAGFMHEIGHSLGLKHGHTTQDIEHPGHTHDDAPGLPANHDSQEYSIMTYRGYPGQPTTEATQQYPQTIMLSDIAAIQTMYGASFTYNGGNTTYRWSETTGELFINGVAQNLATGDHILMTIWDGNGNDTYDFTNYTTDLSVNLNPGEWTTVSQAQLADLGPAGGATNLARGSIANAWLFQGDTRSLIENALGGSGNDTMIGNDAANILSGNNGHDTLKGGGGADSLYGGANNDTLKGGGGADELFGGTGVDTATYIDSNAGVNVALPGDGITTATGGTAQGDRLHGIENLTGSNYADALSGDSYANVIYGGDGNDDLKGLGGADNLDGGNGIDTVLYALSPERVYVDLGNATASGGDAAGDILSRIENLTGSFHNDTLKGGGGANKLDGLNGDDVLKGGGGADHLIGNYGNDRLVGGAAGDILDGGSGTDQADYFDSDAAVAINLANGFATGGTATGDTLISIEDLSGSQYDDTLLGDGNANRLAGSSGNDVLKGGGGADSLVGGPGADRLVGGINSDHFQYASTADGTDTIYDFSQLEVDRFVLDQAGLGLSGIGGLQSAGVDFVQGLNARTSRATVLANGSDIFFDADGTGSQAAVKLAHVGNAMWTVGTTGDFDGNGTTDFLWRNNVTGDTVQWLMSPGGGIGMNAPVSNTAGYTLVGEGDMDANGTSDLLWKNDATGETIQWLMSTTGGIGYQAALSSTAGYNMIGSGDFDANGTTDFMWKHAATGDTIEWLTQSAGGIGYQASLGSTAGSEVVATGDFDANGTIDFLWKSTADGSTTEWLTSPTGGIGYQQAMGNLTGWNLALSGDFDANGTTDFMWKNATTGDVVEWTTSPAGGTIFNAAVGNAAGYDIVMTGDIDVNGTIDFVWKNVATGETVEWLTATVGGIGYQAVLGNAAGYSAVATGDFNGDGASDILWRNAATGETIEWLLSPAGGVGYQAALSNTMGWSVLATGDFNGDGTTDIAWEQAIDGSTTEWMMSANGGILADQGLSGTGGSGVVHLNQDDFLVV